jgi:hypothetical protein
LLKIMIILLQSLKKGKDSGLNLRD